MIGICYLDNCMTLAERFKKTREFLGKSQKDMAMTVGVSFRSWQCYEDGNNIPGGNVFEALVKLGFNANWLLTGKGMMTHKDEYERIRLIIEAYIEFLVDRGWWPPPDLIAKQVIDILQSVNENEISGTDKEEIRKHFDPQGIISKDKNF